MNVPDQARIRFGRALSGTAVVLALAGMGALAILGRWDFLVEAFALHNGLLAVGFGALAWTMIRSQPRNGAVWALAWASFFGGLFAAGFASVVLLAQGSIEGFSLDAAVGLSPSDLPLPAAIALQAPAWAWIAAFLLVLTLGLLLFPDGRPLSPRWKWVGWYSVATIAVAVGGSAVLANPWSTVVIDSYDSALGNLVEVAIGAALVGALASVASLIVRYRHSSGVARRQIRWIAWGGSFLVAILAVSTVVEGVTTSGETGLSLVALVGEVLLIGSFWVAITKYRLYDIDVVISKTVTYASLAVVITALYTGAVLGFVFLFGDPAQRGGDLGLALPIGATALVVVVFEPIRVRLQRWANRLVYGKRAAPHAVLSQLTAQLSDTSAGTGLLGLAELLREGTGAERAVVWLRVGERLRAEAASPSGSISQPREVDDVADLPQSELQLSVPVHHGGELLGALGIIKPRNYPVTPADRELLGDVAAGAGLMLLNLRLNAELAQRAEELQASRRRLIATHDAARHRLERDLHDGAQQQVVALKVKLGLAKTIAEREGATDLAAAVARLADGTQDAVDAMRLVARGIYPPLLEAEGLGAALSAVQRTAELSVKIDSTDFPRYSRPIEETVYFCVLAAVNRALMAGATAAHIDLQGDNTALTVTVTYDSPDQATERTTLTDRIDAFAGTVTVTTSQQETTLTLQLPTQDEVLAPA